MALSAAVSLMSVVVPAGSDSSRGLMLKTQSASFGSRAWASALRLDLKSRNSRLTKQCTICMAAREGLRSKHPVSPSSLEPPPLNLYTADDPYTATFLSVEKITGPKAPSETYNIIFQHDGNLRAWEGQYYGVIPPGRTQPSFYLLASTRYGDYFNGKTASFCVTRVPDGEASNFLCDAKPGDTLRVTGPQGTELLLAQDNPIAPQIMVATDAGIAPFRGFTRRMFVEDTPFKFNGLAWLFFEVPNRDSLLYNDEFVGIQEDYPENFRYDPVCCLEERNKKGGKLRVQDKVEEHIDEVYSLVKQGGYIYFAGLKEIMPPIIAAFRKAAERSGDNWDEMYAHFQATTQWRVLVY